MAETFAALARARLSHSLETLNKGTVHGADSAAQKFNKAWLLHVVLNFNSE